MSKLFKNLNKKELSWVLYDVGNSAYTLLACALIPIWYKSLAIGNGSGQISSDKATAYYSLAISIMTVISAFIGPVCGIIADRRGMKKIMFSGSVVLGVAACILIRICTIMDVFHCDLCCDKDIIQCFFGIL